MRCYRQLTSMAWNREWMPYRRWGSTRATSSRSSVAVEPKSNAFVPQVLCDRDAPFSPQLVPPGVHLH